MPDDASVPSNPKPTRQLHRAEGAVTVQQREVLCDAKACLQRVSRTGSDHASGAEITVVLFRIWHIFAPDSVDHLNATLHMLCVQRGHIATWPALRLRSRYIKRKPAAFVELSLSASTARGWLESAPSYVFALSTMRLRSPLNHCASAAHAWRAVHRFL